MALFVSWAISEGIVITVPINSSFRCLSLLAPALHLQTPLSPMLGVLNLDIGVYESSRGNVPLSTRKEDVEWVKDQIHTNGLHMHENVLRKGINPRTMAQQLEDLRH